MCPNHPDIPDVSNTSAIRIITKNSLTQCLICTSWMFLPADSPALGFSMELRCAIQANCFLHSQLQSCVCLPYSWRQESGANFLPVQCLLAHSKVSRGLALRWLSLEVNTSGEGKDIKLWLNGKTDWFGSCWCTKILRFSVREEEEVNLSARV